VGQSSSRAFKILIVAAGLLGCSPEGGQVATTRHAPAALSAGPVGFWTQVTQLFPGGWPAHVALLPDGRVLCSQRGENLWYTLTPDSNGSYVNGTWAKAPSSNLGRFGNTSFVLTNGRYLICGGEYVTDTYEQQKHLHGTDLARCEYFDPATNAWAAVPADMPETIADTPAVELSNGQVLNLAYDTSNVYLLSSSQSPPTWGLARGTYARSAINNEGDCILLRDSSVLCGIIQFQRYVPSRDLWLTTATTQPLGAADNQFAQSDQNGESPEIGPFLLLQSGEVMVLGATAHNGIFTPPTSGTDCGSPTGPAADCGAWRAVADTPAPYDHGDTPATVEPNGKVLSVGIADDTGQFGPTAIFEWDPSLEPCAASNPSCSWAAVPSPVSGSTTLNGGGGTHFLNLPNGQILFTGTQVNGSEANPAPFFVYTPVGSPPAGSAAANAGPSLDPNDFPAPVAGEFTLKGTQLNGLTTGANFGDDGKMATNYPVVWLSDSNRKVYYARSYNFSQMAPAPNAPGSCKFVLPTNIPNGIFQVHASANGASSTTGPVLVVSGTHVTSVAGPATGANPGTRSVFTVAISTPAPAAGTVVNLSSSAPSAASVPATVTVQPNQTSATFTATLNGFGLTTISASVPNSAFTPATQIYGWGIDSLTGPGIVYDDTQATWTVTLSHTAQGGGVLVNLSSDNPAIASVPATVNVPQGFASVTFPVSKGSDPGSEGFATITASIINSSLSRVVKTGVELQIGTMGFRKCATEGGTCFVGSANGVHGPTMTMKHLAFGANGHFVFANGHGQWPCTTAGFGGVDPAQGTVKSCYISDYVNSMPEGAVFGLSRPIEFAYGANDQFTYKLLTDTTQSYTCNSATFGDPHSGTTNACYIAPGIYTYAVKEGETLNLPFQTSVAYGGHGGYTYKILSGSLPCNNDTFTEPSHGNSKACYIVNAPLRADEGQPYSLTTRGYYGSGTNGEFGSGTPLTGTCSNSFFGYDPDVSHRKHCWGN
jgi:hypothetical protein